MTATRHDDGTGPTLAGEIGTVIHHPLSAYLAATTAATVILFARAPRAFVVPQLFAEDGRWMSLLHTHGFWHAALHGRPEGDYAVVGNVLLLAAGRAWCALVHGGDPLELARCCALVCYVFLAAVVSLPVLLLRHRLPTPFLAAMWLAGCLLPLGIHDAGYSGFEILGRACNAGFACLYAAFLLVWHRIGIAPRGLHGVAVDLGLLLCITTNPVCAAVLPAAAWPHVRGLRRGRSDLPALARDPAIGRLLLVVITAVALGGLPAPAAGAGDRRGPPLDVAGAVEIAVARSTLYPLIWPVYHRLGTATVLATLVALVALVARVAPPSRRPLYLGGAALLAVTGGVLVAFRPGLGLHLHGYRTTFPDRYFLGQNLVGTALAVTFAADVAARFERRRWLRWLPGALVAAWLVAALVHEPPWRLAPSQFLRPEAGQFAARAARAVASGSFVDANGIPDPFGRFVLVPNPEGTPKRFVLPRAALERSLAARGLSVATAARR